MNKIVLPEPYQIFSPHEDYPDMPKKGARGIIEFIIKDRRGNIIERRIEKNIVKIFAKEMLAHRIPSSQYWDPNSNAWVNTNIDPNEEFSARYMIFGASFDENGVPLDSNDSRYYTVDPVTGSIIPIRLGPGAEFGGGLINAIPIAEPGRPLKRIENISFEATYQPSGSPLVSDDVRAMNNIVVLETTLRPEEYNGFGLTSSDFFTITEVALIGGRKFDLIGACECDPKKLFLEGPAGSAGGAALRCIANGSDVVSIDPSETDVDLIKEGDQVKIVGISDSAGGTDSIAQVTPFYLVLSKAVGGRDIQLDRTPVDTSNVPITGTIGVYRDTLRIFSHRILSSPIKKSSDFSVTCKWRIIMN